jgi:hypothetical protein
MGLVHKFSQLTRRCSEEALAAASGPNSSGSVAELGSPDNSVAAKIAVW